MTDDNTDPNAFWRDFSEKDAAFKALSASLHEANKTALFDALQAAGITTVLVRFDGYGDSGQIEDMDALASDQPREFPTDTIVIGSASWGVPEAAQTSLSVREAVEALVYDFLQETHGGWENNEGAYGDVTFTVAERAIVLDYNERIETSEHSQHIY